MSEATLPVAPEANNLEEATPRKPMRFFVDFENVRGAGLKGVDALPAGDEVYVFYSQAADTFHIEQAIDILKSAARIEFLEIDNGTTNALDFQLIAMLFGTMDPAFDYAIVSGDGGFEAAIKMGVRLGLPPIVRVANVQGEAPSNVVPKSKSRTRRGKGKAKAAAEEQASDRAEALDAANAAQADGSGSPTKAAEASAAAPALGDAAAAEGAKAAPAANESADKKPARKGKTTQAEKRTLRRSRRAVIEKMPAQEPNSDATGADAADAGASAAADAGASAAAADGETSASTSATASFAAAEAPTPSSDEAAASPKAPDQRDANAAPEPVSTTDEAPAPTADDGSANASALSGEDAATHADSAFSQEMAAMETPAPADKPAAALAPAALDTSAQADSAAEAPASDQASKPSKPRKRSSRGSGKSGKREAIAALLADNGIAVDQQQLSSVMQALNGVKDKQQLYRNFVKLEGREVGGALYHQVKAHFDTLVSIVRQQ